MLECIFSKVKTVLETTFSDRILKVSILSFKMEHMQVAKVIMVVIGMWRLPLESLSNKQYFIYKLYSFFIQAYFLCFVVCLYVAVLPLGKLDIEKTMEGLSVLILCAIITLKIFICQRKRFIALIGYILNLEKSSKFDEKDCDIYKSYGLYTKRISIFLLVFSSMCGVTLVVAKFIVYTQQLKLASGENNSSSIVEIERPLPYVVWRPVDETTHYFIAFLIDVLSAIIGCTFNTVTQLIILSILIFIAGQLQILQRRFRNLGYLCSKVDTFDEKFEILKKLIFEHQQLISYVENLDDNMKYIMLLEFTISSMMITSVLGQILFFKIDAKIIFSVTYLSCMLTQMFFLAYHANEIKLQSEDVSQAVYESEWYDIPIELKKMLCLVMIRAQRPLKISVGPFFILTTNTAVTSIKAAYSYFTLLKNREK